MSSRGAKPLDGSREMSLSDAGVDVFDCEHKTPPAADEGIPYITIPQMKKGRLEPAGARLVGPEDVPRWNRRITPQSGDVILSRRTNPGVTAVVPPELPCVLGQNLVILRSTGSVIDQGYLRWLVRSPEWWGEIQTYLNVGAVFDSLRVADIPKFRLPVPPMAEQRAIAHVLGTLDDKIELNRRMNATLEEVAQAIFKSWFIDFDGHDDLVESELGPIPEGWKVGSLAEVIALSYGKSLPKRKRLPGDVPVYGSGGVGGHHAESLVDGPGVIVGRKGSVGTVYWESRPFFPIDTTFFVDPIGTTSWLAWAYHCLERLDISRLGADSAVPGVNRNALLAQLCPLPPDAVVEEFDALYHGLRARIDLGCREAVTLAELRDTLLPKLISGEIRVPEAEEPVEAAV